MLLIPAGLPSICDLQLGFYSSPNPPKMTTIVNGRPLVADMYFRLIPIEKIPTDDEEACTKFLYDHYVEKVGFVLLTYAVAICNLTACDRIAINF